MPPKSLAVERTQAAASRCSITRSPRRRLLGSAPRKGVAESARSTQIRGLGGQMLLETQVFYPALTMPATEWHASSNCSDEDHMLYILAALITAAFLLSSFVSMLLAQGSEDRVLEHVPQKWEGFAKKDMLKQSD
jgi:hypothetical protein